MERNKINNAIFLDRDGTIIEDRGHISMVEDQCLSEIKNRKIKNWGVPPFFGWGRPPYACLTQKATLS